MPWTSADTNAQKFVDRLEKLVIKNARKIADGMTINTLDGKPKAFQVLDALALMVHEGLD